MGTQTLSKEFSAEDQQKIWEDLQAAEQKAKERAAVEQADGYLDSGVLLLRLGRHCRVQLQWQSALYSIPSGLRHRFW